MYKKGTRMNANELADGIEDEYVSIDSPDYFRKDDDWWWVELGNIFNNIPANDKFDDQRSAGCAMKYIESLEKQIGCYKIELELNKAMIQDLKNALKNAQTNPLQNKLNAIANKVVFGKAQEK